MWGFMGVLLVGCLVGFGSFYAGQDTFRRETVRGCIKEHESMPHKEVVPYCNQLVDRWSGVKYIKQKPPTR